MTDPSRSLFIDSEGNRISQADGAMFVLNTYSYTDAIEINFNNRFFVKEHVGQIWKFYSNEEIYIKLDDHVGAFLDELREKIIKQETSICEFTFMKLKKLSSCKYQEGFNIDIPMKSARKN